MTLRAVVDSDVFISAQISSLGHPARIARAGDRGIFELVVSERLLSELHDVLMRPRFRRHMTKGEVENLVEDLREKGISAEEGEIGSMVPGDPKDDYLIALVRVSRAGYLVSGDPHLTETSLDAPTVTVLTPAVSAKCWKNRANDFDASSEGGGSTHLSSESQMLDHQLEGQFYVDAMQGQPLVWTRAYL